MFGNANYTMLSELFLYEQQPYPYSLDYFIKTENGFEFRSEDFISYVAMEDFILKQRRLSQSFSVPVLCDAPDYESIAINREAVQAYLHAVEEEEVPAPAAVAPPAAGRKRKSAAAKKAPVPSNKQPYMLFADDIPEGEEAKQVFLATEFDKLAENFRIVTKGDPFFPPNRKVTIRDIWGPPRSTTTRLVNQEFWLFALKEFEAHERARILRGEERSNCFKKGASAGWLKCDLESTLVNFVVAPPKKDAYKPALGSN